MILPSLWTVPFITYNKWICSLFILWWSGQVDHDAVETSGQQEPMNTQYKDTWIIGQPQNSKRWLFQGNSLVELLSLTLL